MTGAVRSTDRPERSTRGESHDEPHPQHLFLRKRLLAGERSRLAAGDRCPRGPGLRLRPDLPVRLELQLRSVTSRTPEFVPGFGVPFSAVEGQES